MSEKMNYSGLIPSQNEYSKSTAGEDEAKIAIINASRQYYNTLTSPNGRFSFFECEDKLFPYAKPAAAETSFVTHRFYEIDGNFLLVGEGGSGKTTALLRAWKDLLEKEKLDEYKLIPIYIPLNEANSSKNENFIAEYCMRHYHFHLEEEKNGFYGFRLLLLLDGFNEITVGVAGVVSEIKRLCNMQNKKVVLTSRYDFSSTYMLENVKLYEIQLLRKETIEEYLHDHNVIEADVPYDLLVTPMMLTLFSNTNLIKQRISKQIRGGLPFCKNHTKGELLYNFMLCQVGKTFDTDNIQNIYIAFLSLFVVSPYIAYSIEKNGKFDFHNNQLVDLIRNSLTPFEKEGYTVLFENELANLEVFGPFPYHVRENLPNRITVFLRNTLAILQEDGQNLSFRHQYFRDYFAAIHVIFDIRIALKNKTIPRSMTERIIPNYIAEFIGDCLQEYEVAPKSEETRIIKQLVKAASNKKAKEIPLLINNIVNILSLARKGDLSGVDFKNIDLSRVSLNGLHFGKNDRCTDFSGARLSASTFLPQGHIEQVRSAIYSMDGTRVLTAGDTTAKEWDAITGQCLMTFVGHNNLVNSAIYSKDGRRVLTAANDNTIREWDRISGQCLRTWQDHQGYATKAIYLPDGSGILSSSWDGTVLLYRREGADIWGSAQVVARHSKNIKSIDISKDGKFCLTASGDNTAKEWRLEDGVCTKEYLGHKDMVNSVMYSPDETSVLTGSYDNSVRIFDRISGEEKFIFDNSTWVRNAVYDKDGEAILIASHGDYVVKELKRVPGQVEQWNCHTSYSGHKKAVTNVSLDTDGARVLSASEDGSVCEWDRLSSQCIKVYSGNMFSTTDTVYSSDGMLVLTIKGNDFSIAKRNEGVPIRYFKGGSNPITSVDFSMDSQTILSTSADGLLEWDRATNKRITYNLVQPEVGYVAEHARYMDLSARILCLSRSETHSQQVGICIFRQGCIEPEYAYSLPIDAEGIEPLKEEYAFLTFSANGVIRKWRMEDGRFLGIDGVEIAGCDFTNCCFLDRTVKAIVEESDVICRDIYISQVVIKGHVCHLHGKSIVIFTKNNSECLSIINDLYLGLQQMQKSVVTLVGDPTIDTEECFRELWKNNIYLKRKVDPYEAFSKQIAWTEKQLTVLGRFFNIVKWTENIVKNPLEEKVVMWILYTLLCDESGEILEECYYCRGIVLIHQIDAGVCSIQLQRRLVAALMEAFPNLQFIISSSSEEIGAGEGAASIIRLGAEVLAIDEAQDT